jgi:hypothetical protein
MHTKRTNPSTDRLQRFNDALRLPRTWHITGVDAFWLEDTSGSVLSSEFSDTPLAYDALLAAVDCGTDPETMVLVGRTPRGRRSVLAHGLNFLDMAEAHAGIPARPRVSTE